MSVYQKKNGSYRVKWNNKTTDLYPVRHYNRKSEADHVLNLLQKQTRAKLKVVNDYGSYAIVAQSRATCKSVMKKLRKIRPSDF